jgi:hypothetical protein
MIDNDLDKLIRDLEGADYYEYQPEPESHGNWPLLLIAFGIIATIAMGYCIAKAIQALA